MEYKNEEISILVIDDDKEVRSALKDFLETEEGFKHISEADSISSAIEIAEKEKHFDVILTDMRMDNDEDGFEIVKQYQGLSSLLIVMTAYHNPEDLEIMKKCLRFGAYDYIEKDEKNEFREKISQIIKEGLEDNPYKKLRVDRDSVFISEKFDDWAKEYPGRYVAVLDRNVIKDGGDYFHLKKEMEKKYPLAEVSIVSIPGGKKEVF